MSTKPGVNLTALQGQPAPGHTDRTRSRFLLIGILLVAAVLRWLMSGVRGLTYDDAFSIILSARPLGDIVTGTAADTMPPLYYFVLHGWSLVSQEIWFLRSLNILVSIGTVYLVYRLAETVAGKVGGLWAAFFTAIAPIQVYHAQDLRMYAILSLAQLGYIGCILQVVRKPTPPSYSHLAWVGMVLCGAVALYSHNLAVMVMPVPFLYALVKHNSRLFRALLLPHIAIGVLAIPWLVQVPGQIAKIQTAFWTPKPGLVEIFQSIILFHSQLPLGGGWLVVAAVVSLQVVVVVGLEVYRLLNKNPTPGVLAGFVLAPPLLLFLLSYAMRPVFVTRAFLVSALAYYVLAGWAVSQGRGAGKLIIATGFIGLSVIGLFSHFTFDRFPRSPFREAITYLEDYASPGDRIIHDNKLSYFPSFLFSDKLTQVFLRDEPGTANDTLAPVTQQALDMHPVIDMEEAVRGAARVHFVVFQEAVQDYMESGYYAHPNLAWLEGHGRRTGIHTFEDLDIYSYDLDPID